MAGVAGTAVTASELWCMGAAELAGAIRSRRASSREVIEAHLRRIEAVNPLVSAVTVVLAEQALQAAEAADGAVSHGEDVPPFHGVPFTVKENIDLTGTATTQGAKALAGAYPARDAPVVERLKAAGAIPIGRTNLPTYGVGWVCESELHGATVNPWDRSRTPGASSGGEAAALATGMTPWGLGNDGSSYPPRTKGVLSALIEVAGYPDQGQDVLAYMTRQSVLRAWGEFQQEHPLIVAPIFTGVPFDASKGYTTADVAEIVRGLRMTTAVNALGLPAVALPVGVGDGLPHAVQVIGPRYREDLCLDAAAALEQRAGIITPIDPRL